MLGEARLEPAPLAQHRLPGRRLTPETLAELGERFTTLDKAQLVLADAALARRLTWSEVDHILSILRYAAGHYTSGYRLGGYAA